MEIIGKLHFSLQTTPTADPPVFTLICIFTGDPDATVIWTRKENARFSAANGTTQTMTNMTSGTYSILTVMGRLQGKYKCRVENNVSNDAEVRDVTGE